MSQSINLGWFCQRNKHLEEGSELAEQKKKIKPWKYLVWKFSIFSISRNVIDFDREDLYGYEIYK